MKGREGLDGRRDRKRQNAFDVKAQFAARMITTSSQSVFASLEETTSPMKTEAVSPGFQESTLL